MRHFVRSQRFSSAQLRDLVNVVLRRRPDDGTWGSCALDGREYYVGDPNVLLSFYPLRLTTLEHFRLARGKNDNVWEVLLSVSGSFDERTWSRWTSFFETLARTGVKFARLICFCAAGPWSSKREFGEFSVSAVARSSQTSLVFGSAIGGLPLDKKFYFMRNALESIGVVNHLVIDGGKLKLVGEIHWPVRTSEVPDGIATLELTGIQSLSDATAMAERMLDSELVNRTHMRMSCTLIPPAYESMLDELNALSDKWQIDLYGGYADGIDPYTAEASQSPDGRFPIVTWNNNDGSGIYFEADIVPTPAGRYLEIHSNCGSMHALLEEAEAATGVRFTPIDPSTASAAGAR